MKPIPKVFPYAAIRASAFLFALFLLTLVGCKAKADVSQPAAKDAPFMSAVTTAPPPPASQANDTAPPPAQMGGFDGNRAFADVAKQVSFGPRPSGSPAIAKTQDYLLAELKSYGCTTDVDSFSADTPAGRLPMKNILVKIPGEKPGIILLGTHYDTKRLANFVGADDAGSSTGVMLESRVFFAPSVAAMPSGLPFSMAKKPCAPNGRTPTIAMAAAKWPLASR